MESSLSSVVSSIFILLITLGTRRFEKLALDKAEQKLSLWLRYVDDTSVIWPHGLDCLQEFCNHISSLIPTIKFIMEIETDSANAFLDGLVIREGSTMNTKIYSKPTHTGRYLHFHSNRPPHVKRRVVRFYTTELLPYTKSNRSGPTRLLH
jgi:hypothetical protein